MGTLPPHDPSRECLPVPPTKPRRGGRPRGHRAVRAHKKSELFTNYAKRSLRDPPVLPPSMRVWCYYYQKEQFFFSMFVVATSIKA